ncbi:hypothetical protein [Burkholderia cenocepacia]|uniref:hypothetical protein n=1 Tax=Burkholderia cenocepacia TaxID=95486 RepID=UPI000761D0FF|nr:hypothetical protein [Burkholderia cenocepacia]
MSATENLTKLQLPAGYGRPLGVYWKPSAKFINELVAFLGSSRVLEVFAGRGYLAAMLAARGVSIKATTRFAHHDAHENGLYYDVEELDAVSAVRQFSAHSDVLLICWPTVTPAAVQAAELWGAERDIVYIGEVTSYEKGNLGGCATDLFFERMQFTKQFESYRGNVMEEALVGRYRPVR